MNTEKFERDMQYYSFGKHQDILNYLTHLETMGWTVEDTKTWIAEKKAKLIAQRPVYSVFNCPECNFEMRLLSVNETPATQTGDLMDKSVWFCTNPDCMHTIYNKETLEELHSKGGK